MAPITYELTFSDGTTRAFQVDPDRTGPVASPADEDGAWTRLEHHQCGNCPLNSSETPHCPAALDIKAIADEFTEITSIERVDVWVHTPDRSYFKNCDAQEALMSLFGLVMATSACPILSRFKPLTRFHLPFATPDETALRVAGAYLIKQRAHLLDGDGDGAPDWELHGIEDFYRELGTVNSHLFQRVHAASAKDANGNAMNVFCSFAGLMQMGVDETLQNINPLAKALL